MWLYVWAATTDTFSQPDSIPGWGRVHLRGGRRNQGCSAFLFLLLQRLLTQAFLWGLLAHGHRVRIPQETRAFGLSPHTMNEDACGRGAAWLPEGGPSWRTCSQPRGHTCGDPVETVCPGSGPAGGNGIVPSCLPKWPCRILVPSPVGHGPGD